jgi:hypothetical protein
MKDNHQVHFDVVIDRAAPPGDVVPVLARLLRQIAWCIDSLEGRSEPTTHLNLGTTVPEPQNQNGRRPRRRS